MLRNRRKTKPISNLFYSLTKLRAVRGKRTAMAAATMASNLFTHTRMLAPPTNSCATSSNRTPASFSLRANLLSPYVGGSVASDFSGQKIRPSSLNSASFSGSHAKRTGVTMVLSWLRRLTCFLLSFIVLYFADNVCSDLISFLFS